MRFIFTSKTLGNTEKIQAFLSTPRTVHLLIGATQIVISTTLDKFCLPLYLDCRYMIHRGKAVLRNTCANGILLNKSYKHNYFKGVKVLQKLVIE